MNGTKSIFQDDEGLLTLKTISVANRFNSWMYETIKPYCTDKILEIGSGIGNISKFFVDAGFDITLSDINIDYCKNLQRQFPSNNVVMLDITHAAFREQYQEYYRSFSTVFALNVIEHVDKDKEAVDNCRFLLKEGGTLIILVPNSNLLYNNFDKELDHKRRYNKDALKKLFKSNSIRIIHLQNFNMAGIFGWFLFGSVLKNKIIPEGMMRRFDKLVPVFKIIDKIFFNRLGLSLIIVGKKLPQ